MSKGVNLDDLKVGDKIEIHINNFGEFLCDFGEVKEMDNKLYIEYSDYCVWLSEYKDKNNVIFFNILGGKV